MSTIKGINSNGVTHALRDVSTFRSLTSTQAIHLDDALAREAGTTADGKYNGEDVENGEVFTKEDGTFIKFEKELVPGQPTFTVVGSPTITDKVISGFSQSDYIKIDETFPNSVSSVDIVFAGTVILNYIFENPLLSNSGETALLFSIGSSGNRTFSIYNNGWVTGTNTLNYGAKYWFRIIYDGSTWTGYTIGDNNYTIDTLPAISSWRQEWQSNDASWILGKTLDIGINRNGSGAWEGSIDLNNSYIKVDGEYWWTPYAIGYVYSLTPLSYNIDDVNDALSDKQNTLIAGTGIDITGNVISATGSGSVNLEDIAQAGTGIEFNDGTVTTENFTVVGSPTITDGIASGFSSSDYLESTYSLNTAQDFEICAKIKTTVISNKYQPIYAIENTFYLGINNEGSIHLNLGDGSSWGGSPSIKGGSITDNQYTYIKCIKQSGTAYVYQSSDGETWGSPIITFNYASGYQGTLMIGNELSSFDGSIDLNNCYIKVGGSIVWTPYISTPSGKTSINASSIALTDIAEAGEGIIFTPGTEKEVNFTIVGNLSTTDGIVSGFSENDYLYINKTLPASYNSFDFITKGNMTATNNDCIIIAPKDINAGSIFIASGTSSVGNMTSFSYYYQGAVWGTHSISTNVDMWFRVKSDDGINFKGYSLVDNNYTLDTLPSISSWTEEWSGSSVANLLKDVVLNFGLEVENVGNYWKGSIDFNNTAIYVDENLWWEPYTTVTVSNKTIINANLLGIAEAGDGITFTGGTPVENFTKIGNPTIIDGIASFSDSSYLQVPFTFPATITSFDFIFKANSGSVGSSQNMLFARSSGNESFFNIKQDSGKFSSYNSGWFEGTNSLTSNTDYWFRVRLENSNLVGYTLEDNNYTKNTLPNIANWRQEFITSAIWMEGYQCNIGINYPYPTDHWTGTVNLPECSIECNGKVWTPYLPATKATINADIMTGATASVAGSVGIVPAPLAGDQEKFLRGDGTWQTVSSGGSSINKYTANNTALTSVSDVCTWTVTHNLGTKDVVVSIYDLTTGTEPMYNVIHNTTNSITIELQSSTDIVADSYRVVVLG